ncbi:hypothetical protein ABK040_009190 [Willaertia magna]
MEILLGNQKDWIKYLIEDKQLNKSMHLMGFMAKQLDNSSVIRTNENCTEVNIFEEYTAEIKKPKLFVYNKKKIIDSSSECESVTSSSESECEKTLKFNLENTFQYNLQNNLQNNLQKDGKVEEIYNKIMKNENWKIYNLPFEMIHLILDFLNNEIDALNFILIKKQIYKNFINNHYIFLPLQFNKNLQNYLNKLQKDNEPFNYKKKIKNENFTLQKNLNKLQKLIKNKTNEIKNQNELFLKRKIWRKFLINLKEKKSTILFLNNLFGKVKYLKIKTKYTIPYTTKICKFSIGENKIFKFEEHYNEFGELSGSNFILNNKEINGLNKIREELNLNNENTINFVNDDLLIEVLCLIIGLSPGFDNSEHLFINGFY